MRKALILLSLFFVFMPARSQTQGKPISEIFADFHYFTKDSSAATNNGFGITRAYFGYNYQPVGNFTATAIVNIGSPSDLAPGSKDRKYAYFREASVSWTNNRLSLAFGMTSTRSLTVQQRFVNKRYIAESFGALDGYTHVADVGFVADYTINDIFKVDFTLMNGEGYHKLHNDNSLKSSFGVTITPIEKGIIRLYADFNRPNDLLQQLYIGFIGFRTDVFMIGSEIAYKTNINRQKDHNTLGISATGSVKTSEKTEIFARYDYITSNSLENEALPWNYNADRQFFIAGFQYTFNEYFRLALDYQGTNHTYTGLESVNSVLLNLHFKF